MKKLALLLLVVFMVSCSQDDDQSEPWLCDCEEISWRYSTDPNNNEKVSVSVRFCELSEDFIETANYAQARLKGISQNCKQPKID